MIKFEVDAHRKHCLLNGLDDIGLTMAKSDKIERFEDNGQGGAALGVSGNGSRPPNRKPS